jgi:hypothetical protein
MKEDLLNPKKVGLAGGANNFRQWAYKLHEKVNMKLFWQDVVKNRPRLWSYWLGYQPPLARVKYAKVDSKEWYVALFNFLAYIVCDFPKKSDADYPKRRAQIVGFLPSLGRLVGHKFKKLIISEKSLDMRLTAVHTLFHDTLPNDCIEDCQSFIDLCKSAIVGGCQKINPEKVGCV